MMMRKLRKLRIAGRDIQFFAASRKSKLTQGVKQPALADVLLLQA